MPSFLANALPFLPVALIATVCALGSLSLHIEGVRAGSAKSEAA